MSRRPTKGFDMRIPLYLCRRDRLILINVHYVHNFFNDLFSYTKSWLFNYMHLHVDILGIYLHMYVDGTKL